MQDLERTGALENAALFVNLADDPAVERLITPQTGSNCRRVSRFRA